MASSRAGKTFSIDPNEYTSEVPRRSRRADPAWLKFYTLCIEMIGWAKEGFGPGGHDAIMPSEGQSYQLDEHVPNDDPKYQRLHSKSLVVLWDPLRLNWWVN